MSLISIRRIRVEDISKNLMEQLSTVLTYEEPQNFGNCFKWWETWFSHEIPGDKITIIAEKEDSIVGVVRFWRTPFCNNKWLIEGLEVISPERKKGIGKSMVLEGIDMLRNTTNEEIFVHIANKNTASIKLHESIGFKKVSTGSINSYGYFRAHVDEYLLETFAQT
ncbi:GNAT family N-acetyltransferase [Clostridium sp.]|uniref:GNAT family N-acetyltransferase n=1 Tax=Clostridium sp. TaxID=1506 RepID=UPI002FC85256